MTRTEVVPDREWYRVDCAVPADGTSPATEFLDALRRGVWEEDPDSTEIRDDEQVKDYHKLLHKMRYVADNGEPERPTDVNYLRDGIWEFKVAAKRVAFYDTDGAGTWVPKPKLQDRTKAKYPESRFWWFPVLDVELRLLNAWPKLGQRTRDLDMTDAVKIAQEDVEHDVDAPTGDR